MQSLRSEQRAENEDSLVHPAPSEVTSKMPLTIDTPLYDAPPPAPYPTPPRLGIAAAAAATAHTVPAHRLSPSQPRDTFAGARRRWWPAHDSAHQHEQGAAAPSPTQRRGDGHATRRHR